MNVLNKCRGSLRKSILIECPGRLHCRLCVTALNLIGGTAFTGCLYACDITVLVGWLLAPTQEQSM
jgi:hypothetical protein